VFDRGRPWQGGHGQLLGGLGSDAPCVGGSDLRGQRQAGRGSWYWELGNSRSWRRRPKYISLVSLVWNLAPLVYLLFKISFPPLLETSKCFFSSNFPKNKRIEKRRERIEKMTSRTPAITIVEPSIHDGDDLSTFRSAPCFWDPLGDRGNNE
jgi:hypothetical protein